MKMAALSAARPSGAANATTVRYAPVNAGPKPRPATAVPISRAAGVLVAIPTRVTRAPASLAEYRGLSSRRGYRLNRSCQLQGWDGNPLGSRPKLYCWSSSGRPQEQRGERRIRPGRPQQGGDAARVVEARL